MENGTIGNLNMVKQQKLANHYTTGQISVFQYVFTNVTTYSVFVYLAVSEFCRMNTKLYFSQFSYIDCKISVRMNLFDLKHLGCET